VLRAFFGGKRSPEGSVSSSGDQVADRRSWLQSECQDLASRFDQRNGNAFYHDLLAEGRMA
jgi:hypothetical protein